MSENPFIPGVGGNTRENRIKTFLAKPPKNAAKLVMAAAVDEGAPIVLGEWERAECVPALSSFIVEKLEQHAEEMGGTVQVELTFVSDKGQPCGSLMLKRQANHIDTTADLALQQVQGDARSLVVQAQTQSFMVQKLYLGSMHQVLSSAQAMAARADEQAERYLRGKLEAELELERVRAELAELREALAAAEEMAQQPASTPVSEAQERLVRVLEPLVPVLVQRLLSAGSPPAAAA